MRDIKFRAWDCDNKIMVYPDSELEVVFCFGKVGLSIYHCIGYELNSFEVMQYTGLKDKNGKEIYEGDILKFFNDVDYIMKPGYAEVIFEDGTFACKHFKYGIECLVNMDVADMDITVAGNIYENPELLEGN